MFGTPGEGGHFLVDGLYGGSFAISTSLGKLHLRPHHISNLVEHIRVDGRRQSLPHGGKHIVIHYNKKDNIAFEDSIPILQNKKSKHTNSPPLRFILFGVGGFVCSPSSSLTSLTPEQK